jgi:hypothetical protein
MGADMTPDQALELLMEGNRRWIEERQNVASGLQSIVDALHPAYRAAKFEAPSDDLPDRMVRAQTSLTTRAIAEADSIAPLIGGGDPRVLGAHYYLHTGEVELLA